MLRFVVLFSPGSIRIVIVLPSAIELLVMDKHFGESANYLQLLKHHLAKVAQYFDIVLIDTQAGHVSLIVNAIFAAEGNIIVPLDSGVFAYESLETFSTFLTELVQAYHLPINLMAILLREDLAHKAAMPSQNIISKFWKRKKNVSIPQHSLEANVMSFLEQNEIKGVKVHKLPYANEVVLAQIEGMPVSHYATNSKIAKAYQNITTMLDL